MFNFTTQQVINHIVKGTVANKGDRVPKNANLILNTLNEHCPKVRIGNTRFDLDDIVDIQVKNPSEESLASVTFDLSQLIEKVTGDDAPAEITARIALYIGLSMNSQDSFYANDFVYKGKPFFIEFYVKKGDTVDELAARVEKIAKKFLLFQTQEKILDVTATATAAVGADPGPEADAVGEITFTGVNGYQQIKKAELQWYNPEAKTVDCCTMNGEYETLVYGVPVIYTIDEETGLAEADDPAQKMGEDGEPTDLADNEVAIMPGLEAFCDYNWLIHNLRLPTLANTNFWSFTTQQGEMPIVGQKYTQFIVRIKKDRIGISGQVIGMLTTSVTTHVFYAAGTVDEANTPAYEINAALTTTLGATAKVATDADDKLAAPFEEA